MSKAIFETKLPLELHSRGKVRDTYELPGGDLLMIATDRISAFDVVLPTPIPEKGAVLTQLSRFWFDHTPQIVRNHLARDQSIPAALIRELPDLKTRAMRVVRAKPIPFECVVRGYISGSGWKEYKSQGTLAGRKLPPGLLENAEIPGGPVFTPATKALTGHDENISTDELADRLGSDLANKLEQISIDLYRFAAKESQARGLILADTKFEFGWLGDEIILIDEVLTPDSSRYWPLDGYQPGRPQPSFDKQYVRDYLESLGWNKQPPAPALPEDVVEGTRSRYREAAERFEVALVPR
jgi:phosphoribosylaminoimidazole-succinocarboxamide synthase